ncbi:MAG: response regulator [Verrucomicrobia bacterium]|nr:MAG: response regulator [Verrucomicrobiota bacterium]
MATAEEPNHRILILDDDEIVLLAIKETLAAEGYDLATFSSANEALRALDQEKFSVILSDQRMPEMSGLDFLSASKKTQPNASRILITGVLTLNTVVDAVNKGEIFRFLAKPWIREELLATVRNGVQRFQLLEQNDRLRRDTMELNRQLSEANRRLEEQLAELTASKKDLDRAHEALRTNFNHSLELCYRLIETFHPVLGRQTKAVASICTRLAEEGQFSEQEKHVLTTSAWLNNIGMIGLPRNLVSKSLSRPDDLTEAEVELIRHHPIYGQTLASFVDDLRDVGETIRAHHERYDGRGYPDRLGGDDIPLPARHLAVAVAFVESNLPRDRAMEAILRESGRAFDPEAVRLFLKVSNAMNLPRKVREVTLAELAPGQTLASGIYSPSGLLLIPEDRELTDATIRKIKEHNAVTPITHRLLVYMQDG